MRGLLEEYAALKASKGTSGGTIAKVSKSVGKNGQMTSVKELTEKKKDADISKAEVTEMTSFVRRAKAAGTSPNEYFDEYRYLLRHYGEKLREVNKVLSIDWLHLLMALMASFLQTAYRLIS